MLLMGERTASAWEFGSARGEEHFTVRPDSRCTRPRRRLKNARSHLTSVSRT